MEKITLITLAICATIVLMVLIVFLQANFANGATIEDIKSEITYQKVESLGLDISADFINLNVNNQFYAQYQNSFNNYFVFVELKTVDTEPVLKNTQQEKHNNEIPLSVAKNIPKPDYYNDLEDRVKDLEDNSNNDNNDKTDNRNNHNNDYNDSNRNDDVKDDNNNDRVVDHNNNNDKNEDINAKDDKQAVDSDDSEEMSETVEDSEIPEPNDIEENSD